MNEVQGKVTHLEQSLEKDNNATSAIESHVTDMERYSIR